MSQVGHMRERKAPGSRGATEFVEEGTDGHTRIMQEPTFARLCSKLFRWTLNTLRGMRSLLVCNHSLHELYVPTAQTSWTKQRRTCLRTLASFTCWVSAASAMLKVYVC